MTAASTGGDGGRAVDWITGAKAMDPDIGLTADR
jgi:hypothetical protein